MPNYANPAEGNLGTAAGRYGALQTHRELYLRRAREVAALTIPTLLDPVDTDHPGSLDIETPWQSLGARGVNNLASKLLLSLMPPNQPFFKLQIGNFKFDEEAREFGQDPAEVKSEFQEVLSSIEQEVMAEVDSQAIRVKIFEALKQLLVVGNILVYQPDRGGMKLFRLDRYVVRRDEMGTAIEIIVKECFSGATLPAKLHEMLEQNPPQTEETVYEVYTRIHRVEGEDTYEVYQEFMGREVPDSRGTYKSDNMPWHPLRGIAKDGEDYGRSYAEEYAGDLRTLEGLQHSIAEGTAAAVKLVWLVNPAGMTRIRSLVKAKNGSAIPGRDGDVTPLQAQKALDIRVAKEYALDLRDQLGFAFLLNTAIQRDAERVTATEIRAVAQELEDALGGMYSLLSQEFLLPVVNQIINQLESRGSLPNLKKLRKDGIIKPTIVVGLAALGRGHDLARLDMFVDGIAERFGPDVLNKQVSAREYMLRRAAATGIDSRGLVKSEETLMAEAQAIQNANQQAMAQPMQEELVKGVVKAEASNQ